MGSPAPTPHLPEKAGVGVTRGVDFGQTGTMRARLSYASSSAMRTRVVTEIPVGR